MALSPVVRMLLINGVERVLHAPGNPTHELKEMTLVLDYHMNREEIGTLAKDVAGALKAHSHIFANVRCNLVRWQKDDAIQNEICPLAIIQLGRFLENYEQIEEVKKAEILCDYLKRFHARSRLILVLSDLSYTIEDRERLKNALVPFLKYKLLFVGQNTVSKLTEAGLQ